jgi:hypothetical protein
MTVTFAAAASLRGTLPHSPAGAAGLYAAAELHTCPAHALMTAAQVSSADVAHQVLGLPATGGQSPLALGRGTGFERQLTRGAPSRLQTELAGAGFRADRWVDVAKTVPMPRAGHGRDQALAAREAATVAALTAGVPAVVWQGALTVTLGIGSFRIQPDLLLTDESGVRIGEVKSWPTATGGFTLAGIGMLWLTQLPPHSAYLTRVVPAVLAISLGMGHVFVPLSSTALLGVPAHDAGAASALVNTMQQVGGALGVAFLNTIATSATRSYAGAHGAGPQAAVHGFTTAFAVSVGIFAVAVAVVQMFIRPGQHGQGATRLPDEAAGLVAAA